MGGKEEKKTAVTFINARMSFGYFIFSRRETKGFVWAVVFRVHSNTIYLSANWLEQVNIVDSEFLVLKPGSEKKSTSTNAGRR